MTDLSCGGGNKKLMIIGGVVALVIGIVAFLAMKK
jgi:hypothetical protein